MAQCHYPNISSGSSNACPLANCFHAVSFLPISLLGLLFMAQDGMTLSKLKQMKSTAEAEEHPAADRGGVQ